MSGELLSGQRRAESCEQKTLSAGSFLGEFELSLRWLPHEHPYSHLIHSKEDLRRGVGADSGEFVSGER